MKRLRDTDGGEPLSRRGAELLRSTPPAPDDPEVRARVWREIETSRSTKRRGIPIWIPRLALVAIVALVAGTAGAVITHRWMRPKPDAADVPAQTTPPHPLAEKARPIAALPPVEELAADRSPSPNPGPKAAARSTPKKVTVVPPPATAAAARERTEVLDALVALRRQHDAVRAGTMLGRYLSAHPHGSLREEALALAIEAADARGDRPGAAQLAQLYQQEFPAGRFLTFARGHIEDRAAQADRARSKTAATAR
jgi:hypothetical protein